jgi:hypothetical protein
MGISSVPWGADCFYPRWLYKLTCDLWGLGVQEIQMINQIPMFG